MFLDSFENGLLSTSLRGALITRIPKPGKPRDRCQSFQKGNGLNSDIKLLCKALACRLEDWLPSVIKQDHNGFVKDFTK